jgi:hypothetical protein
VRVRIFLLLLAAVSLWACSQPLTVEQQVIAVIREMEARIEAGERLAFMDYVASDFSGRNGTMNHDQVKALVVFQLNRHKRLQAQLFPIRVESTDEARAEARFRALVTGGPNWLPESGQVFDFVTRWRLEDGEWLLYSADWEPIELEHALDDVI